MNGGGVVQRADMERHAARTNLSVLRRRDPAVTGIVAAASHVAVYTLVDGDWARADVEGALLLVARSTPPHHRVVVVNRKHPTNHAEDVDAGGLELETKGQMVMYRVASSGDVRGLWFLEPRDCVRVYGVLEAIVRGEDGGLWRGRGGSTGSRGGGGGSGGPHDDTSGGGRQGR